MHQAGRHPKAGDGRAVPIAEFDQDPLGPPLEPGRHIGGPAPLILRARLGDLGVIALTGVIGVFELRAVQGVEREIDHRAVGDENHQEERAENGEDAKSGQRRAHGAKKWSATDLRSPVSASVAVKVIGVDLPSVASAGVAT